MNSKSKSEITCGEVRALLPAFLADEISASESRKVHVHLDGCPECRRFRGFEDAFDGMLKRTLRIEAAPPSLVVRVHQALRDQDAPARGRLREWATPGWRRWAMAAAILLAVLAPSTAAYRAGLIPPILSWSAETERSLQGTLVCAACERVGRPVEAQRGCRVHGHHVAFKCDESGLWELVENDLTRPLILDASRVGDRVEMRGVFLDDIHYVKVNSFRFLPETELARLDL
jgi:anti-sigma factor (TIGR02949 family)